jgi:hypothetical protein
MVAPVASVLAGIVMTWLAVASSDGLVVDDYYKQGLAINRTLQRDVRAQAMGLRAEMSVSPERSRVAITVSSANGAVVPAAIRLHFAHPGKSGMDQVVMLAAVSTGRYEGVVEPLTSGRWLLTVEDADRTWRLNGEWRGADVAMSAN